MADTNPFSAELEETARAALARIDAEAKLKAAQEEYGTALQRVREAQEKLAAAINASTDEVVAKLRAEAEAENAHA